MCRMVLLSQPAPPERWVRGAGSGGIGTSGHVNEYRPGVLVHNFVEDTAGAEFKATGRHTLGFGAPFSGNTMQRCSYTQHGKTGEDLLIASQRNDKDLKFQGVGGDLLVRHGEFWEPRDTYFATINQLTLKEERHLGEPRVSAHVWSESNRHNAQVTHNTQALSLTTTKRMQWQTQEADDPFMTTAKGSQMIAAQHSAAHPGRSGTLRPVSDGQPSTTGRRPKGEFAQECDKPYRRNGLRDIHYSGSIA